MMEKYYGLYLKINKNREKFINAVANLYPTLKLKTVKKYYGYCANLKNAPHYNKRDENSTIIKHRQIFDSCNNNRALFKKMMRKTFPHLKDTSLTRYFRFFSRENKKVTNEKPKIIVEKVPLIIETVVDVTDDNAIVEKNDVKSVDYGEDRYSKEDKDEPNPFKMIELRDMKDMGYKITREFLYKYGFSINEVNWLEDNRMM